MGRKVGMAAVQSLSAQTSSSGFRIRSHLLLTVPANIKVSLCSCSRSFPAMLTEMHFFLLFLIPYTSSHLPPLLCVMKSILGNCCVAGDKKKEEEKSKSHGSSTRAVDDIIATTELLPFRRAPSR